jgi:hypothetical protein
MKIKKVKFDGLDSFNDYTVELSYGQLVAMRNALEKDHSDPLSDELYAELNYYLQNIPGPGENSDEFKQQRDGAKKTQDEAGGEVAPENAPASDTELEAGKLPAPPTEGEEPFEGGPEGAEAEGGPEGEFQEGPKLSPEEREIIDRAMPTGRPTGPGAAKGPLGAAKGVLLPPPPQY